VNTGIANLPTADVDHQTKCGKCFAINITVITQFFRFQSKFERCDWCILRSASQHHNIMGTMESGKMRLEILPDVAELARCRTCRSRSRNPLHPCFLANCHKRQLNQGGLFFPVLFIV